MVVYTTPGIVKCESFESGKLDGFGHSQYGAVIAALQAPTSHHIVEIHLKVVTLHAFFSRNISAGLWPISQFSENRLSFAAGIPGYMVRHASLLAHFHTIFLTYTARSIIPQSL